MNAAPFVVTKYCWRQIGEASYFDTPYQKYRTWFWVWPWCGLTFLLFSPVIILADLIWLCLKMFSATISLIATTSTRGNPPINAEFLFYLFLDKQNCDAIVGDLEERYKLIFERFGPRRANFWYWIQTAVSLVSLALAWVKRVAGEHIELLADVFVHFVFLSLFTLLSVGLEMVVGHFHAHGFELIVFRVLQGVFGVSTIGPTTVWLVRDLKALAGTVKA